MALEMVLNELSLQPASDIHTARQWMSVFVRTISAAASHRVGRVMRTQSGVSDITLAAGYPLSRWVNDGEVDRVARLYVLSLTTKVPLWDGLPELCDQVLESEFKYEGQVAYGLGVAYLLESLAVSLPSDTCWNAMLLPLNVNWLVEGGCIEEEIVRVIHASRPEHLNEHREWIQDRLRSDIQDGDDLWKRREGLFSSLTFCEGVGRQIQDLSPTMLRPVVRRLFELEAYCQEWTEGGFDPDRLPTKATPESQPTLDRYGRERTFRCPDGEERTFSWHVRLTPNVWRIHFHPRPGVGQMIIGYVGPHLRTVRHH